MKLRCVDYAVVALLFVASTVQARPELIVSEGWQVSWDESRGTARRTEDPSANVILYEQPDPSDDDCDYNELRGRVLSVVGSLVSFETTSGWYCQGNAHPGVSARFHVIDLDTGTEVDIRSLVPETTIMEALKQDVFVANALNGRTPEDLRSLTKEADGGCAVSFWSMGTSFAFYELREDMVAVRFGLGHGCEVMQGALNEVEVELPLPEGLDVEDAERKGYLMNKLAPGPVRRYPEE